MPCFLNATKATQFRGSCHFQVFLPVPLNSCLFLPTTFRLALVVKLYSPLLTVPMCSRLSLCFFNVHSELCSLIAISKIACPSSWLVARNVKRSINTSLFSLELLSGHFENCSLMAVSKIACPSSWLVVRDINKSINLHYFS